MRLTRVRPIGTTTTRTTGTTTSASGWFAPKLCGILVNRRTSRFPAKALRFCKKEPRFHVGTRQCSLENRKAFLLRNN